VSEDANKGRQAQLRAELDVLRALCDPHCSREQRAEIIQVLKSYRFNEAEHHVLFESICTLSSQPAFSAALLATHLNNRGFPDVDLEKYFVNEPPSLEAALALALALSPRAV
jgi:hypothetical protein